jgi:hypothetical protein
MPGPQQLPTSSLLVTAGLAAFYMLPSLIALARGVRGVVRLNVFTGWTGVGWLVSLARACRPRVSVVPWR